MDYAETLFNVQNAGLVMEPSSINSQNAHKKMSSDDICNSNSKIEEHVEKFDISPENLEKSSDSANVPSSSSASNEMSTNAGQSTDISENSKAKGSSGLAFTINFGDEKVVDDRKLKEFAERLQQRQKQQEQRRHNRGASLSKLDDTRTSQTSLTNFENSDAIAEATNMTSSLTTKPPPCAKQKPKVNLDTSGDEKCAEVLDQSNKVVLRRPRPDIPKSSSKRHSWSPRSSINCGSISPQQIQQNLNKANNESAEVAKRLETVAKRSAGFQPKSATLLRAFEKASLHSGDRSMQFRAPTSNSSKAIKKPFKNPNIATAPLEYVHDSDDGGSVVSEAGTYTLDGDNYTEEEKERMSIDKFGKRNFGMSIDSDKSQLKHSARSKAESYNSANYNLSKPLKLSYLNKIKNRVKNIGDRTLNYSSNKVNNNETNLRVPRSSEKTAAANVDHGVFTSITACGVLNKQQQQQQQQQSDNQMSNAKRKNSLIKLQIDSSEYIQPKFDVDENALSSYTDYEKAKRNEYQLNIFSTASSYTSSTTTSPLHTDDDNLAIEYRNQQPINNIISAPTKNDWIQEWARNARRRSLLNNSPIKSSPKSQTKKESSQRKSNDRLSHSYHDSDIPYFKYVDEYDDDTSDNNYNDYGKYSTTRPMVSPTKIPSPKHTQIRPRSSSANPAFHNNINVSTYSVQFRRLF